MNDEDSLPPLHKDLSDDDWADIAQRRVTWRAMTTGEVCVMGEHGRTARGSSLPRALYALWRQLA